MPSFNCTTGSPFSTLYVVCNYTVGSANVASNYTPVTVQLSLVHGGLNMNAGTDDCSVSLGGTTKTWTGPGVHDYGGGTVNLGSTSFNVYHNSDGTWSGTLSVSYRINITYSGTWIGTISGSRGITLPTIPRASSISTGTLVIGSGNAVSITRASSSFTHDLTLKYGSLSTSVYGAGTSATITPPMSWCNSITKTTSVTGTLTCTTKSGSSTVGTTSISVTISIPSSVKPSISASASPISGFEGMYLTYISKCKVSITGSGSYGSSIRSYTISGGGYTSSSSSYTTGILTRSGQMTFTCSCTDSRGRQSSTTVTITVQSYSYPKISISTPYRCTSDGTASEDGTYAAILATFSYSSLSGKNSITCNAYYRLQGASSWGSAISLTSGSKKVIGGSLLDYNSYEIRITIKDEVSAQTESIYLLPASGNYLFSGKLGKIGIGTRPPSSGEDGVYVNKAWEYNGSGIEDLRNNNIVPGNFGDKYAKWYFDQAGLETEWKAIQQIKGWTGSDYVTTEFAYPAGTEFSNRSLQWRVGFGTTWTPWRKLLDSVNASDSVLLRGTYTYDGGSDTSETSLNSWLDGLLDQMINNSMLNVTFSCGAVSTYFFSGFLVKITSSYGFLFGYSYYEMMLHKIHWNGTWRASKLYNINNISDTVPISRGGTGATSAAGARVNIGIYNATIVLARNNSTVQDIALSTLTGGQKSETGVGGILYAINGDRRALTNAITAVTRLDPSGNTFRLVFDAAQSGNMRVNTILFDV